MKTPHVIYLTSKRYPSFVADDIYAFQLAMALSRHCPDFGFYIGSSNILPAPYIHEYMTWKSFRSLYIFFYVPYLLMAQKWSGKKNIFFTNDKQILHILSLYKKIFTFHLVVDWHMPFSPSITKKFLQAGSAHITTSEKLRQSLLRICPTSNIHTVYGGVLYHEFSISTPDTPERLLEIPVGKKYLSYIGGFKTFGEEKGLTLLIDALQFLPPEYAVLLVGGKPIEIKEYQEYAAIHGQQGRVEILGRIPHEEIGQFMRASEVLVIPYPDEPQFREFGFPMKTYEYMAAGRPIVYSALELAEEILSDCALSFFPGNAKDLASKILYLEQHPDIREKNVQKASHKAKSLDWDAKAKRISDILATLPYYEKFV
jgi:glycosyltransferase involved in cell wall biosynthesis